jgi:hypothetical protein
LRISKDEHGYGIVTINGKRIRAHRFAYETREAPIPAGLYVLHRCDTPACVRPSHLWLGTQRENMEDTSRKGRGPVPDPAKLQRGEDHWTHRTPERKATGERHRSRTRPDSLARGEQHYYRINPDKVIRGERHANAKLSDAAVAEIRATYAAGTGGGTGGIGGAGSAAFSSAICFSSAS